MMDAPPTASPTPASPTPASPTPAAPAAPGAPAAPVAPSPAVPAGPPALVPPDPAVRATPSPPRWVVPALVGVAGLAAFLYLWNLTVSGYGNSYYAMAAQAAAQDWRAFFFGSLDAGNFITLDKPPLATWVMGISVRVFGLSAASVLVPQALAGVATVLVVFAAVRRSFGQVAGIIAALVTALTPAAVLIFRYDNPDAILALLLVAAAYAFVRSLEAGSWRWVLLAAALVGAGFLAKYLQAWMVLPAFAVTYLVAAPGGLGRRLAQLGGAAATVLVTSLWWVGIVDAIPAFARPYIGGSETNSALDLLLGYNGFGRLFGEAPGGLGRGPGGSPFGGEPGLLRLFNEQFDGQVAWLLPFALIALGAGLWLARRAPRTDARRAGYLLWGTWLLTHALVFSFMSGIVHPYYSVILAPAIGALVGAGVVDLWGWRERSVAGGVVLGGAVAVTAVVAAVLLARTPDFVPWLAPAVVMGGGATAVFLALPAGRVPARVAAVAVGLALVAVLAGPAAYAGATMDRALAGGDPQAGPTTAAGGFPGLAGGFPGSLPGDDGRPGSGGDGRLTLPGDDGRPGGGFPGGGAAMPPVGLPGGLPSGGAGGDGDAVLGRDVLDYLVANRGGATWLVAVPSANTAGPIQLATGIPVMAMGGFSGSDPAPTLEQLQSFVRSGELRFVMASGRLGSLPGPGGARGPGDVSSGIATWVTEACTPVRIGGDGGDATGVEGTVVPGIYDCGGATD
jgi:4-amino-4-deoxy-L-arabinose transferase-like glycosyltransferase